MALIVQKFGGTSVGNVERIKHVATLVAREKNRGNDVAVVVSAMSGVTNQMVGLCTEFDPVNRDRDFSEYDTVVATGEQVTAGLLAMALKNLGLKSRSWQGWQIPIITDSSHSKARIEEIKTEGLKNCLENNIIPVITGFQGSTADGRITTLGRGGSDTSAVAIAAALNADRCDIYTDVDGVYTCDPRIVSRARKLSHVTYEEMLEMASLGAKVLQTRSVEMAMNHKVKLQVLSTFQDVPGTFLVDEEEIMEKPRVTGLAYNRDESRITLLSVPNTPGVSARIFGALADAEINVDMIVQNVTESGTQTDMTFTVPKGDLQACIEILKTHEKEIGFKSIVTDSNVTKISVIGVGMRSHSGVAKDMFAALGEKSINIQVISTSEIKISVLIDDEYTELALRALHTIYGLDAAEEKTAAVA